MAYFGAGVCGRPDEEASTNVFVSTDPVPQPCCFTSFGEFASTILGTSAPKSTLHIFSEEKTPVATVPPSPLQQPMAFRLVDPEPFMPPGAQRHVVNGRLIMRRVIIGHMAQLNNDLAIAVLQPMPQGAMNFMDIRNVLEDFLHQHAVGFCTIQPCPYGQAYVHFNYIFERDLLIQGSPHPYGNSSVSFLPHNRAWNNRTTMMTHEVWLMMLGLNLDLWTQPLIDKAVSSFGRLMIWEEDLFYV